MYSLLGDCLIKYCLNQGLPQYFEAITHLCFTTVFNQHHIYTVACISVICVGLLQNRAISENHTEYETGILVNNIVQRYI